MVGGRRPAKAAAAAALLALCLGLAACGGGGGSTSSTSPAPGASAPTAAAGSNTGGRASREAQGKGKPLGATKPKGSAEMPRAGQGSATGAGPASRTSRQSRSNSAAGGGGAVPANLRRKAGNAAPFLAASGDNSIPTYGAEASGSQQSEAAAALEAYLRAREEGDWQAACSRMAAPVVAQLRVLGSGGKSQKPDCPAAYGAVAEYGSAAELADPLTNGLASFRVEEQKGFALFYGPGGQQYMMPMVSEGGEWKVNQIAPVPYPVGAPAG